MFKLLYGNDGKRYGGTQVSIVDIRQQLEREVEQARDNLHKLEQALALLGDGGLTSGARRRGRPPGQANGRAKRGTAVEAVLAAVKDNPDSKPAILAEASGLPARSVYATTNRLLGEGRLARGPEGGYVIADEDTPAPAKPAAKKPPAKEKQDDAGKTDEPAPDSSAAVELLKPQE